LADYKLSEIYVFPVKSLGAISVSSVEVTDRGVKYDRRWMLIDKENTFLSQRKLHKMALLKVELNSDHLIVSSKVKPHDKIEIPFEPKIEQPEKAVVWDDVVNILVYEDEINKWFSDQLETECRFVFMPDKSERKVDEKYAKQNEITSLSDGYPFLIAGQESLNLLNSKLGIPLPMNRFRPNLVFIGGAPHDEDKWQQFKINEIIFKPVKPCSRCVITTIDQETAEQGTEPLKTLSTYRLTENNKVMFGMNLLHEGRGTISVGEELIVI